MPPKRPLDVDTSKSLDDQIKQAREGMTKRRKLLISDSAGKGDEKKDDEKKGDEKSAEVDGLKSIGETIANVVKTIVYEITDHPRTYLPILVGAYVAWKFRKQIQMAWRAGKWVVEKVNWMAHKFTDASKWIEGGVKRSVTAAYDAVKEVMERDAAAMVVDRAAVFQSVQEMSTVEDLAEFMAERDVPAAAQLETLNGLFNEWVDRNHDALVYGPRDGDEGEHEAQSDLYDELWLKRRQDLQDIVDAEARAESAANERAVHPDNIEYGLDDVPDRINPVDQGVDVVADDGVGVVDGVGERVGVGEGVGVGFAEGAADVVAGTVGIVTLPTMMLPDGGMGDMFDPVQQEKDRQYREWQRQRELHPDDQTYWTDEEKRHGLEGVKSHVGAPGDVGYDQHGDPYSAVKVGGVKWGTAPTKSYGKFNGVLSFPHGSELAKTELHKDLADKGGDYDLVTGKKHYVPVSNQPAMPSIILKPVTPTTDIVANDTETFKRRSVGRYTDPMIEVNHTTPPDSTKTRLGYPADAGIGWGHRAPGGSLFNNSLIATLGSNAGTNFDNTKAVTAYTGGVASGNGKGMPVGNIPMHANDEYVRTAIGYALPGVVFKNDPDHAVNTQGVEGGGQSQPSQSSSGPVSSLNSDHQFLRTYAGIGNTQYDQMGIVTQARQNYLHSLGKIALIAGVRG